VTTDLDQLAEAAGRTWAEEVRDRLRGDGRPAVGMWPGTLTEARGLADGVCTSRDDRERVAKVVYAAARRRWAECRDVEAPGEPPELGDPRS
jgi:hypothetical protein